MRGSLHTDGNKVFLLFSNDASMDSFRTKIAAYTEGRRTRENQRNPDYSWLKDIDPESVGMPTPDDRIGKSLRRIIESGGPEDEVLYWLDIDLWFLRTRNVREQKIQELGDFVTARGGRLTDTVNKSGILMARVQLEGVHLAELLAIRTIASVDVPPRALFSVTEIRQAVLDMFPIPIAPGPDAPRICILDSGVARGHPLIADAIGETIAIPNTLGDGLDLNGHGTFVAGIALYGDVPSLLHRDEVTQEAWIDAACVTNANGQFDDEHLIVNQMSDAITYFANNGCRIFNISLGDADSAYDGGKPSPWAAILDNLAHDLDVVIVVSAGNYRHHEEEDITHVDAKNDYPRYLLKERARIIEPATAANVLTVGAIAFQNVSYQEARHEDYVPPIPLAKHGQPSPFTRSGFGVRRAIKPDVVEYGGNYAFDVLRQQLITEDNGLSMVSLSADHSTSGALFTFDRGTSFAAPRVARAAASILTNYPNVSANLIRALLVSSTAYPTTAYELDLADEDLLRLYGYGKPNIERAIYSSDSRVVLIGESEIGMNQFHIYEVPIPPIFRDTPGRRSLSVSLAFDPPVRHRRIEYLGCGMAFRLYRDCTLDQVYERTRARRPGQHPESIDRYLCDDLRPKSSRRDPGTLQHAIWPIQRNQSLDHREPFFLVVRNERLWLRLVDPAQKYAVVITMQHEADIALYQQVVARTRVSQRARIRR